MLVCDTTAINYLLQIGYADLIGRLYGRVLIPEAVLAELRHPHAPVVVREWVLAVPYWVDVQASNVPDWLRGYGLHAGEAAAIALALHTQAEFLLTDDRRARRVAHSLGLPP